MQIKTTMRYDYTSARLAEKKNTDLTKFLVEMWNKHSSQTSHLLVGI